MATEHDLLPWGDEELGNMLLSSSMTTTPRTMVDGHETFQGINSDNDNGVSFVQSSVDSELGEEEQQFYSGLGEEEYAVASGPGLDQGQYLPARDDHQVSSMPTSQVSTLNDNDMTGNIYINNGENAATYQYSQDPASDFLASQAPSVVTTDEEHHWSDYFDQFRAEAQNGEGQSVENNQELLSPYDDWVPISTFSDSMPSDSFATGLLTNGSLPIETDSTLPDLTESEEEITNRFAAPMDAILNNDRWSSSAIADFNTFMAAYPRWMPVDTATLQRLCLQMGQRIKDLEGELDEKTQMALRGVAM